MLPSHSQPLPTPHHTLSTFILFYLLCLPSVRVFILARSFLPTTSSLFPMTVTSPVDVIALPDRDRSSHALATLAATPSFLRCHRRVQPKVSQRVPYASACVCVCVYASTIRLLVS